jgi:DNA-binding MarR family transcriptional regulator
LTDLQIHYEPTDKYAHVPRSILSAGVSSGARLLWAALASYAWNSGSCYPSQNTIGELLGVDVRTIRRWTQELESASMIEVVRPETGRGKAILYHLLEGGGGVRLSDKEGGAGVRSKGAAVSAQEPQVKLTATTTAESSELISLSAEEEAALESCNRVAESKGVACRAQAILRATRQFADRDIPAEAESFAFWFCHGGGEKVKLASVAQTWRNWLSRSASAQQRAVAVERKGRKKEQKNERLQRDLEAIRRLKGTS